MAELDAANKTTEEEELDPQLIRAAMIAEEFRFSRQNISSSRPSASPPAELTSHSKGRLPHTRVVSA